MPPRTKTDKPDLSGGKASELETVVPETEAASDGGIMEHAACLTILLGRTVRTGWRNPRILNINSDNFTTISYDFN
ncbi:unnamed protein product [Arabidopsis halleri]